MNAAVLQLLLSGAALSSLALGALVLGRNTGKRTHRTFAFFSITLAAWAAASLLVATAGTPAQARLWMEAALAIAGFVPAAMYHFIAVFPFQRFDGNRWLLGALYAGGLLLALVVATPWYIQGVTAGPGGAPIAAYGPAFNAFAALFAIAMIASFANLAYKLRDTAGLQRRQIEMVFFGVFLATMLAAATNIFAPLMNIGTLELYGPCFFLLLSGFMAYAMMRYQLLDIRGLLANTTTYALLTCFVLVCFFAAVGAVQWIFSAGRGQDVMSTGLAALFVALGLHPFKERVQLVIDRWLLQRRYDTQALIESLTRESAQNVQLDALLEGVSRQIAARMGVRGFRVLLADPEDPDWLITAYSAAPEEIGRRRICPPGLAEHFARHPEPVLLEAVLLRRPDPARMLLAAQLADFDAMLCVPLRRSGSFIGLLTLGQKRSGDIYTREDLQVFAAAAPALGTAIDNARLYQRIEALNLHFERILADMRGGVVTVNAAGTVTTVNQRAREMLGSIREGKPLKQLPEAIAGLLEETLVERRGVSDFEMRLAGPDGESIPVLASSAVLAMPGAEQIGAMVLLHDLSEIKRLESNVQRADRLSSLGTLAAGMAHEIKNPLVSIKTFSQLLLERYQDPEYRNTFAEVVPQEVDRIDTIVSRLLDFARPRPVEFAPQEPGRIIRAVIALVENQASQAGAVIQARLPEDSFLVRGDEQQLYQVILNLLLNAIDAVAGCEERVIEIALRRARARIPQNGQHAPPEQDCVQIIVSDSGAGMPAEHLEQVFTPFFTTKARGSGLGLAVVHGIVSDHGGGVDVSSVQGVGSVFTVTLPQLKVANSAGRTP